jgi:methionyl-tRNA formyltransferase
MQVGFAGTPAFAATALDAILRAAFPVALVLTRPDRPQGRGLRTQPSPVKALAEARRIAVLQPSTLKSAEARAEALAIPLDVLVVAAYGLLLPPEVLAWPRHGCINIHASLLPRWRGAAPIERAILAGDAETGICLMQMDEGLDTGPVIDRVRLPIAADETAGDLAARLAAAGATAIVAALERLRDAGSLPATAQPVDGVTHAPKIMKSEAAVDWNLAAAEVARRVRAFNPAPGATTALGGQPVKLWRAEPLAAAASAGRPGEVLATELSGIVVACGDGALRIVELQGAGGRRMAAAAFVAGRRLARGDAFDALPPPGDATPGAARRR